jgi:hypothetical protein
MNLRAQVSSLSFVEHDLREVGDLLADREQGSGRNDDLELRHQGAVLPYAIPDTNISVACILLQNVRYVISRNLAQHFRWELLNSHDATPDPRSADDSESCALSGFEHKENLHPPQCYGASHNLWFPKLNIHSLGTQS